MRTLLRGLVFMLLVVVFATSSLAHTHAAFNQNLIIDDTVFSDVNSMNAASINNWLNTYFPNSCISPNNGFSAPDPTGYSPGGGYTYGGNVTAGQVIYDASQVYGINPQVLLVTLQKEQSLVSGGGGCSTLAYTGAMGYGCPDSGTTHSYSGLNLYTINGTTVSSVSGTCVNTAAKAGFSQQVVRGAWLLRFGEQRALGNTAWNVQLNNYPQIGDHWDNSDDPMTCYGGPMTQGNLKRCATDTPVFYDGYTTIDGTSVHMDSGATAALYWYTPHFHGNQNFYNTFTSWFGGTISGNYYSCHNSTNIVSAPTGEHVVATKLGINHSDNLSLTIPNNTGSACAEVHTWLNGDYSRWIQHIASNSPSVNPSTQKIIYLDGNGDGVDEPYKIDYSSTGSGMIEVHCWDSLLRKWVLHIATNRPAISTADAEILGADPSGGGRDSLFLVQYRNTGSGHIEIHQWSPNLQQWVSHIATNYGEVDPATAQVISADTNGDGRDEFYLVNYSGSSGRIEVHGWTPNFQQWSTHIATNSPSVSHVDGSGNPISDIISADTNGDGRDEFYKVDYTGTGSGRVEIHGWTPNFQQWSLHAPTSQGAF